MKSGARLARSQIALASVRRPRMPCPRTTAIVPDMYPHITSKQAFSLEAALNAAEAMGPGSRGFVSLEHPDGTITDHSLSEAHVMLHGVDESSPVSRLFADISQDKIEEARAAKIAAQSTPPSPNRSQQRAKKHRR